MGSIQTLITDHIDVWTGADTEKKSGRGRASGNAASVYGVMKLRELILELAVRGKLVPQDANDEPASELLKRITEEKIKLIAEGKIKKSKPLSVIGDNEKPFEVPKSWAWVRLSQVSEANTGYAFKSGEYTNEGTLVLRVTNINTDGTLDLSDAKYIDSIAAKTTYKNFQLKCGDVLLVMVGGSLGKLGVVEEKCLPAVLNQNMWKMIRFGDIERDYFLFGLRYINSSQIEITNSTHGHLAQGEYLTKLFPLPPLAEQHRIVTKVDELMALCDQLENQHTDAIVAHEKLVSYLLDTLTQSQDAADFNENWQRIAANFEMLFTTESSIEALKQTLLQLAVMGKLVPQNASDEPASELLKRIQAEKVKLVSEGKIKKTKPLTEINDEKKSFELPKSWTWTRLGDITQINPRNSAEDKLEASFVPMTLISTSYTGKHEQETRAWGEIKKGFTHFAEGDVGVAKITPCFENSKAAVFSGLVNGIGAGTTELHIVRSFGSTLNPRFILIYFKSPRFLFVGESKMTGTAGQKRLPKDFVSDNAFPLPPLAEQHRIVAKVDELMTLCDTIKTRITAANQLQQKIADVMVMQAVA